LAADACAGRHAGYAAGPRRDRRADNPASGNPRRYPTRSRRNPGHADPAGAGNTGNTDAARPGSNNHSGASAYHPGDQGRYDSAARGDPARDTTGDDSADHRSGHKRGNPSDTSDDNFGTPGNYPGS